MEPQVFGVLAYLVEHRDRVVTKNELLDKVWGDRFVSESALTTRIKAAPLVDRVPLPTAGADLRRHRPAHDRGERRRRVAQRRLVAGAEQRVPTRVDDYGLDPGNHQRSWRQEPR